MPHHTAAFGCERSFASVARHLRYPEIAAPDRVGETLARSIEKQDIAAVNECLLFAIEHFGQERIPAPEQFVNSALRFPCSFAVMPVF